MIDHGQHSVLGVLVNAIDYEAAVERIAGSATKSAPLAVTALAVHGVMTGVLDKFHRHRLNSFDLVCPDGQPVRWALNRLHHAGLADRVYGPTLMLKTCARAAEDGLPIFLLGGDDQLLHQLQMRLRSQFPDLRIAGARASKFRSLTPEERAEMIGEVRASGARILFVGLGCPRQEVFVYECCQEFRIPCLAVGAAFAFHAGTLAQAPRWMQQNGLEWLFRLLHEPTRLWKRYLLLNPAFAFLLLMQLAKIRKVDATDTLKPTVDCCYG